MPTTSEPNLPPDMLMMLGRMDGKLDSLLQQVAANTAETKEVRDRVSVLEQDRGERKQQVKVFEKMIEDVEDLKAWRSEISGGTKGVTWAANLGKMLIGAGVTLAGFVGIQAFAPHKPVAKAEVTIERSIQVPAPASGP